MHEPQSRSIELARIGAALAASTWNGSPLLVRDGPTRRYGPWNDNVEFGNWSVVCRAANGSKVAWSMPQLLGAIESRLTVLEQQVAREGGNAAD